MSAIEEQSNMAKKYQIKMISYTLFINGKTLQETCTCNKAVHGTGRGGNAMALKNTLINSNKKAVTLIMFKSDS